MILIVGGAGYIGSHVNKLLTKKGFETVIFDNLSRGHRGFVKWGELFEGDLLNIDQLRSCFENRRIEAVMHFSAFALVEESVLQPETYYRNNVIGTLNLLQVMREFGVKHFIFSSTCATYGHPEKIPIPEDHPQNPINPYGWTKLLVEQVLKDYDRAYGLKHINLRYFNAAGADPEGDIGELHQPETHLIPLVIEAAMGLRQEIRIFGTDYPTRDGTCIRDYIHVMDLADTHIRALQYLMDKNRSDSFNLGNGNGHSVREVIEAVRKVSQKDFKVVEAGRREGDPPVLISSSKKAIETLKWKPQYEDLETIIETAWQWHNQKLLS
ncbi:MAG: UDP-glucose 4-epimerase GalE [Deltaproteobacteria bacterium]|nr:UDP-glucose 4-epimerase GalE [Deltaproteobacteria bacterium]